MSKEVESKFCPSSKIYSKGAYLEYPSSLVNVPFSSFDLKESPKSIIVT
jgi:hypothetical protein